jgi:enoyl-CoA hydratase/carnithine racemase
VHEEWQGSDLLHRLRRPETDAATEWHFDCGADFMTDYKSITCTIENDIAIVELNRPPVNAVNQDMYREISDFFSPPKRHLQRTRAVVLMSAGKHFSAGNDLHEFVTLDPTNSPIRMLEIRRAFFAISDCPIPVIGAVTGVALGTGVAIAASCDFVIAAEGASFGVPELSVGVLGGARHLARLVPLPILRWMYYTADPVPAERLAQYGAIVAVVPSGRLRDEAVALARRIARHSPQALRYAKLALNTIESMDLKPGYEFEQGLTNEFSGHPHSKEAVRSVLEHREPRFGHLETELS